MMGQFGGYITVHPYFKIYEATLVLAHSQHHDEPNNRNVPMHKLQCVVYIIVCNKTN